MLHSIKKNSGDILKKSDYVKYLRDRHLERSGEISKYLKMSKNMFEKMIKNSSDDDMIDSYRICPCCGEEWLNKKEMESLILKYEDPERILNEIPSGHE